MFQEGTFPYAVDTTRILNSDSCSLKYFAEEGDKTLIVYYNTQELIYCENTENTVRTVYLGNTKEFGCFYFSLCIFKDLQQELMNTNQIRLRLPEHDRLTRATYPTSDRKISTYFLRSDDNYFMNFRSKYAFKE